MRKSCRTSCRRRWMRSTGAPEASSVIAQLAPVRSRRWMRSVGAAAAQAFALIAQLAPRQEAVTKKPASSATDCQACDRSDCILQLVFLISCLFRFHSQLLRLRRGRLLQRRQNQSRLRSPRSRRPPRKALLPLPRESRKWQMGLGS